MDYTVVNASTGVADGSGARVKEGLAMTFRSAVSFVVAPPAALRVALMFLSGLLLPLSDARAQEPVLPGLDIIMPYMDYPDEQTMDRVSGTITTVFRAQGSFSFPRGNSAQTVEYESLDLTLTVRYSLTPKAKEATVTRQIQGSKRNVMEDLYSRRVKVETYSGSSTIKWPALDVHWSKARKAACFEFPGDVAFAFEPGNTHIEEDHVQWGDKKTAHHDHETHDMQGAGFVFLFPSHSIAATKFAQYLNGHPGSENLGGWVEGPSPKGATSGSYTMPMFFECVGWHSEGTYLAKGKDPRKPPGGPALIIWPGSVQVVWSLGNSLPEGKMTIAADDPGEYAKWIPAPIDDDRFGPASALTFSARILPKEEGMPAPKGKIDFWLRDVSREKGLCLNYPPKGGAEEDLRFKAGQDGLVIDPKNPRHATTKEAVEAFSVSVEALDPGAYGNVQATCDELGLIADDERTHLQSIAIPMDDNRNHVADAWEEANGVLSDNLQPEWDAEKVDGQKAAGDSVALYANYRGFMVLKEGKPAFTRLDPKKKTLFVIDDGNIFDAVLWQRASDIVAYKLNDSLTKGGPPSKAESRIVDFNSGDVGSKYCVRLIKQQGLVEGQKYEDQDPNNIQVYGYTDNQGHSPKGTLRCVVFPARLRAMIDRVASYVDKGVKDPASEEGKLLEEMRIPPWLAQKALERLDQATRDQLAKQMVTLCVIHELGHACGLSGHRGKDGKECDQGDPKCPMKYDDRQERRQLLILQVIFALDHPLPLQYDRFCRERYNCFGALNVKD